jgi:hypothetical protein
MARDTLKRIASLREDSIQDRENVLCTLKIPGKLPIPEQI